MIGAGGSVREKFEIARAAGFEGVEMDCPSDLDLEEVLAARDAVGLAIPGVVDSVHWRDTLSHADPAVRALEDCARLGGTSVLLVPAVVNSEVSYDQAWERSRAEIARVLPRAEELGVAIAIENVWNQFLLSPLEAARYVDPFESRSIGFHFDVGNVVAWGWPAVTAALDGIGYAGWATAEVGGGDAARLADVAARMRGVLHG